MARSNAETLLSLLDCPVCMQTFNEPKQLNCGHTLCGNCIERRLTVSVCRESTERPPGGLPTNFTLANLVTQIQVQKVTQIFHVCMMCEKQNSNENVRICHDCGDMCLCLACAIDSHNGHDFGRLKNEESEFEDSNEYKPTVLHGDTPMPLDELRVFFHKFKENIDLNLTIDVKLADQCREFATKLSQSNLNADLLKKNGFDETIMQQDLENIDMQQKEVFSKTEDMLKELQRLERKSRAELQPHPVAFHTWRRLAFKRGASCDIPKLGSQRHSWVTRSVDAIGTRRDGEQIGSSSVMSETQNEDD